MISRKKFGIGMLVLAMLLVSIALVTAASAAADKASAKNPTDSKVETFGIKGLDAKGVKQIEAEVSRINKMPDTIKKCPYMPLLVANEEEKKVFLGYIDKLSVSDSEKKEMKNSLQDIWSRVPNKITEKDYPVMTKIGKAITDYVADTYWKGGQSVQWMTLTHQNLISAGVNLVYKNSQYASWASAYAMYPDDHDTGTTSLYGVNVPNRQYYHCYIPAYSFGLAPNRCASYAASAKSYYKSKSYQNAFNYLGIASHYLSDVAQPMHSGGIEGSAYDYVLSVLDPQRTLLHTKYEQYVNNNWNSGRNFGKYVAQNTAVKSVTDPASAVKSMASYSTAYSVKLWNDIYAHPTEFDSSGSDTTYTQYVTIIMNQEAAKYNAGLAAYLKS